MHNTHSTLYDYEWYSPKMLSYPLLCMIDKSVCCLKQLVVDFQVVSLPLQIEKERNPRVRLLNTRALCLFLLRNLEKLSFLPPGNLTLQFIRTYQCQCQAVRTYNTCRLTYSMTHNFAKIGLYGKRFWDDGSHEGSFILGSCAWCNRSTNTSITHVRLCVWYDSHSPCLPASKKLFWHRTLSHMLILM